MHSICTYTYVRALTYTSLVLVLHEPRIQGTNNERISFEVGVCCTSSRRSVCLPCKIPSFCAVTSPIG